jgi:hypothetical protein
VDGVATGLALRAVNANGLGPESDTKSVTTTTASQDAIPIGTAVYTPGANGGGPVLDIIDVNLSGTMGPYSVFLGTHGGGTSLSAAEIEAAAGATIDALSLSDADGTVTGLALTLSSSLTDGHLSLFIRDSLGAASAVIRINGVDVDAKAPVLTQVVASATGTSTANWQVATNEAGGTIYVRARASGTTPWTATEILANPDGNVAGNVAASTAPALYGDPSEPGLIALWDAAGVPDGAVTALSDLVRPFDLTAVAAPTASSGDAARAFPSRALSMTTSTGPCAEQAPIAERWNARDLALAAPPHCAGRKWRLSCAHRR